MVRERGYGAGDVRINTHIDVDEDIYSLGFATAIKDDVLNRYFNVFKGELINLSDESDSSSDSDEGEKKNKKEQSEKKELKEGIEPEEDLDDFSREMEEKKQVALEQRSFEIKKQKRLNIFVHVVLTFGFQIILVAMVFYELWNNC